MAFGDRWQTGAGGFFDFMDNQISINLNTEISVIVYQDGEVFFNQEIQVLTHDDIIQIYDAISKVTGEKITD